MADTPYSRSVAAFEALVCAVQDQHFSTPAALVRQSGLPTSSGYRHLTAVEGDGLLARDRSGAYVVGPTALRIGLSAFGVGQLAVLAPPILLRLREVTGRTVFLAVRSGNNFTICAFSLGRTKRDPAPSRVFTLSQHPNTATGHPLDVFLAEADANPARFHRALLCPVPGTDVAYLGLFTGPDQDGDTQLSAHLMEVVELFQNIEDPAHDT
ncbi:hypothetical protein [uncultured Tateyamaria sp.]|uniref:hypothetical protein n=1 Tax=uncultured Tateyamaria sp. TaxID=455651 RepID=UPI00260EBFBD|nr:hypothetical protein [uncultured Tateyamaria sp.]